MLLVTKIVLDYVFLHNWIFLQIKCNFVYFAIIIWLISSVNALSLILITKCIGVKEVLMEPDQCKVIDFIQISKSVR